MLKDAKAIIFDLDGTVADTIWATRDAINSIRPILGLPELTYDDVKAGVNNGARNITKVTIADPARVDDEEYIDYALKLYMDAYSKNYTDTRETYPGMVEAVKALKAKGYRIGMLSNKPDRFVKVLAEQLFGKGVFEVARGPLSDVVKPDPRLTEEVIAELDPSIKPSECVMVGDSDVDIATAKNAGMMIVGVAWGYRGRKFLEEHGADVVIDEPSELPGLFE